MTTDFCTRGCYNSFYLHRCRVCEKATQGELAPASFGDRLLDQHRFRPLGKLVVGNLDRIADVDNVGN